MKNKIFKVNFIKKFIIQLIEFDQSEFYSGSISLDTSGYLYVPKSCSSSEKSNKNR